jgi:hypothetical protein
LNSRVGDFNEFKFDNHSGPSLQPSYTGRKEKVIDPVPQKTGANKHLTCIVKEPKKNSQECSLGMNP